MSDAAHQLDLGKLLRLRAMVTAAQVAVSPSVATALVKSHNVLVGEMQLALQEASQTDLEAEFSRLFPLLPGPTGSRDDYRFEAASAAALSLAQMGGWIQGLIEEATFDQRMRVEAEERAKMATKPATGFAAD